MSAVNYSVFYEMANDSQFPFYSINLDKVKFYLESLKGLDEKSFISIKAMNGYNSPAYIMYMSGIINNIKIPFQNVEKIIGLEPLDKLSNKHVLLRQAYLACHQRPLLSNKGDLIWVQGNAWPVAYSTFLTQVSNIVLLHKEIIDTQIKELGVKLEQKGYSRQNLNILSEYPRHLPTRMHYSAASLGAWLGGSINVQYLACYATIRQIFHSNLNVKYLTRMGFSEETASVMDQSGLIGVPKNLYNEISIAQGNFDVFGSIAIDEINAANPPKNQDIDIRNTSGLIVDKYYRAPYFSSTLDRKGIYGIGNVFRDHYNEFYRRLKSVGNVRCKNYCIPIIEVENIEELNNIIESVPKNENSTIYLRGQTKLYTLHRESKIKEYLFGNSCSTEPSLVTSASRCMPYDYDQMHYKLRSYIEQRLHSDLSKENKIDIWNKKCVDPTCELDFAITALAQHYGLPSNGLDITTSEDVAVWFATNKFNFDKASDLSTYTKMLAEDWSENPEDWPVVLICQVVTNSLCGSVHKCEELDEFGFEAMRPIAQKANFFHGGHSDHQNRLAEALVCAIRLKPGVYETKVTFEMLFPSPDKDPAYRLMLDFSKYCGGEFNKWINRFH